MPRECVYFQRVSIDQVKALFDRKRYKMFEDHTRLVGLVCCNSRYNLRSQADVNVNVMHTRKVTFKFSDRVNIDSDGIIEHNISSKVEIDKTTKDEPPVITID